MASKSIVQQVQERKERGAAIVAADVRNVAQVSHTLYLVRGSEGSDYKVTLIQDAPRCECQDFTRNGATLATCKHIEAARLFNRIYEAIETNGSDLLIMRAITEAGKGSPLHRKAWEAVLSVVRYQAGQSPAVNLPSIARKVAGMAVAA